MRIVCLLVVTFSLSFAPCAFSGEDDEDRADKYRTPEEVEKDRQAFLKRLGDGPVYQVDILYRSTDGGRLYLCQTLLSAKRPRAKMGIPALGLDDKGKAIPVPDARYVQIVRAQQNVASKNDKTVPIYPPARPTRYLGAH